MKQVLLVALMCVTATGAIAQRYINPNAHSISDAPIVIELPRAVDRPQVYIDGALVASQQSGSQLIFVADFAPAQQRTVELRSSDKTPLFPSRVHAQMFLREGKEILPRDTISATQDNMYNKLHHHGPAFESELVAYRIYFDKKQTIDIYGKRRKGMEVAQTLWYPTDQQLAEGYGDDVLKVYGSVGVGALKGIDTTKGAAIHITPVERRVARIVEKGPIRTVVEMAVQGWDYQGKKIDMTCQYTLYAGHRDVEVVNKIKGASRDMTFTTGVMKMRDGRYMLTDSTAAVWGRDYPVTDTLKFGMESCGMAIEIPKKYIVRQGEDRANHLFVLRADQSGEIRYRFTFSAAKEEFGSKDAEEFFRYVGQWANEQPIKMAK